MSFVCLIFAQAEVSCVIACHRCDCCMGQSRLEPPWLFMGIELLHYVEAARGGQKEKRNERAFKFALRRSWAVLLCVRCTGLRGCLFLCGLQSIPVAWLRRGNARGDGWTSAKPLPSPARTLGVMCAVTRSVEALRQVLKARFNFTGV